MPSVRTTERFTVTAVPEGTTVGLIYRYPKRGRKKGSLKVGGPLHTEGLVERVVDAFRPVAGVRRKQSGRRVYWEVRIERTRWDQGIVALRETQAAVLLRVSKVGRLLW